MRSLDDSSLIFCIIGIPDDLKREVIQAFTKSRSLTNSQPLKSRVEYIRTQIVRKNAKYDYFDLLLIDIVESGYTRLQPGYFRDASGVIVTFDKGDKDSFTSVAGLVSFCYIIRVRKVFLGLLLLNKPLPLHTS